MKRSSDIARPRLLVFASGTDVGGGTGFQNLVESSKDGRLEADIVGVVSNHEFGGVYVRAKRLDIPFHHFPAPWSGARYQEIANVSGADFFALSGWLKYVTGLELGTRFSPTTVFNIHPSLLPRFGGIGMYGDRVHEAVFAAYMRGEISHTGISMHFVTEASAKTDAYDKGPVFFQKPVPLIVEDTVYKIQRRVNAAEHKYQPLVTNLIVHGYITWDGVTRSR